MKCIACGRDPDNKLDPGCASCASIATIAAVAASVASARTRESELMDSFSKLPDRLRDIAKRVSSPGDSSTLYAASIALETLVARQRSAETNKR